MSEARATTKNERQATIAQTIDGEDISGQRFVCVSKKPLIYRNSPNADDLHDEEQSISLNEVVQPSRKYNDWIRIGETHWLPLIRFWDGSREELMRRYKAEEDAEAFAKARQAKIDAELNAMTGDNDFAVPRKKSVFDGFDAAALESDEDSVDSVEMARIKDAQEAAQAAKAKRENDAAVVVQAIERGRQQRVRSQSQRDLQRTLTSSPKTLESNPSSDEASPSQLPTSRRSVKRSKSKRKKRDKKKKRSKSR